ncbi:U3 snoRNP protein [Arachnomyces sp. PD_36]|nr:U3 snoRNP protein [Arachnomyces sp. PD_36]
MAAPSAGFRSKPPKLRKKGTATEKTHRFEPFSQRIAKLKIDPIHRVRRTSLGDGDGDDTPHFKASLDHWAELNLSENFTEFSRRVSPLSESLAQILYHEEKIIGLLLEYIGKRDQLSMEPLLDLIAQYARDLGPKFEKHFAPTITLVASIAGTHADIEVIEWSFTCLAWIFKFLSRLLVPDLRQLLEIMAPYLGKERQKPFVTRFVAESMSFLIRKAGLVYYKNKTPLERAVTFLFQDLGKASSVKQIPVYQEGLMTMFAEAIKGPRNGIHSNGPDILRCLVNNVSAGDVCQTTRAEQVLSGVVVNIIHHTTADTLTPLLGVIHDYVEAEQPHPSSSSARISVRLLFLAIVTRKGTRINDWTRVHRNLLILLNRAIEAPQDWQECAPQLLSAVAIALQTSPMGEVLTNMRQLMDAVANESFSGYFLSFCALFSKFGHERFHSVVLPYFQRFIISSWRSHEAGLCFTLPKLHDAGCVTSQTGKPGCLACPKPWKEEIVDKFTKPNPTLEDVALLNVYTKLLGAMSFSGDFSIVPQVAKALHQRLMTTLPSEAVLSDSTSRFTCGQGFLAYVELARQIEDLDPSLWGPICSAAPHCSTIPVFLEAALSYISYCPNLPHLPDETIEVFSTALINNLSGSSHTIRLLSLKILQKLLTHIYQEDEDSSISIAIEIEECPLTLQSARFLSMKVRRLALNYSQASSKRWLERVIPSFCFGLLSKKFAPVWDDCCEALKAISEHKAGETFVTELTLRWLQDPSMNGTDEPEPDDEGPGLLKSLEFQCSNVHSVEHMLSGIFTESGTASVSLVETFESTHAPQSNVPISGCSQALRVLNAAPHVGEKHSRQLVPLFLSWALKDEEGQIKQKSDSKTTSDPAPEDPIMTWNFKDKKSFLSLFGKFVNPKVLYKASEVYEALLGLLSNGDTEVQKLSLKALFTWKSPSVRPYEENLMNILDDARFKEEVAAFVHIGQDNSTIEEQHREELLPVLLRLLYGKMVARGGSYASQGGQEGRRKAILRTLSQLPEEDFELFVQISFGSIGDLELTREGGVVEDEYFSRELVGQRKQFGLLKMVETMLETLKSRMLPYAQRSMNVILYCLVRACRELQTSTTADSADANQNSQIALARSIRQLGIHCLDLVFAISPTVNWDAYLSVVFDEVINPRLENFAIETAQGISGILHLFHTWASHPQSALYLVRFNELVIPRILDCLEVESAQDQVKIFVMDEILVPIVNLATGKKVDEDVPLDAEMVARVHSEVLAPHVEYALTRLGSLLKHNLARQITISGVETLSILAPNVKSSQETTNLIGIATYLLSQSQERISPKTKGGLMRTLEHFIPLYDIEENPELSQQLYNVLSSLFDYFKDEPNRDALSRVFVALAGHDPELKEVATLCTDLNSVSVQKLDEVDYERRLGAFNVINEEKFLQFNAKQWRPLLFNLLYHIKDEEELAIRSSAAFGLRRFIETAGHDENANDADFKELVDKVLLPSLHKGVKQKSEMVRSEFVATMGYFIKLNPKLPAVSDMYDLLVNDDDEASFFNNILHIQQHRRLRAMRRLAAEASLGKIQTSNISSLFLPLIEHFVFDQAEDESAHNMAGEAISTIGALSGWLEWSQFRAVFRRYKSYMQSKTGMEKTVIKLLGRLTDALTRAANPDDASEANEDANGDAEMEEVQPATVVKSALARTMPGQTKVSAELTNHFIPFFTGFVHNKDESEVSLRLPIAVTTVKLLKLLPEEDMALLLPSVLLDISYILRSRSQDSRDVARRTLAEIAIILGPSYFGYILKELRSSLLRGYQLHVLSFTVHSILVSTSDHFKTGDLNHCVGGIVSVVMDDIFGAAGQEKDAEEYISQMKEVKSSKSYDSMELLAKNISIRSLADLIRPIQTFLGEKLTAGLVKKIDELLRRIGVGLLRNPEAESRDLLVFCYEVIKEAYRDPNPVEVDSTEHRTKQRFLIKMSSGKRGAARGSTSSYTYKLSRFALDILRSILNKFNSLLTANNLAGFLPIIGDAMVQAHEEVKLSAIRLLSTIIKLPLDEIDKNSGVYLTEAVKIIKEAHSTNSEASQAALKLIASMLRERRNTKLKDSHLAYLLQRLSADIEEPDRQGVTFSFIRAVMSRKFMVPEMYELVDQIGAMMVTNQTRTARDLARGVYVHFLVEYPQAKSRWKKQLGFMAKNFEYQYREGRQSVMEAVHLLLSKTGDTLAQDIVGTFFLPVIMVMANDESPECREMAGALLGELYNSANTENLKSILTTLRGWLEQTDNTLLTSTGLQAIRIFFDSESPKKEAQAQFVGEILPHIIHPIARTNETEEWEVLYYALQLFIKVSKLFPDVGLSADRAPLWADICECLFFPHAWVKTCAANLVGIWLADLAKTNASIGYGGIPLAGNSGLNMDKDIMLSLIRASFRCLKTPGVSEDLAGQTMRNIVFLGRAFAQNGLEFSRKDSKEIVEDEGSSDESDDGNEDKPTRSESRTKTALHFTFEQASGILRREPVTTRAESLVSKTASMRLLAALCNHLEVAQITPSLQIIILPLHHLTDPSIPPPRSSDEMYLTAYKALVSNSQEILDLLQKKFGTTEYVAQMTIAKERIKERREGRRTKRRIEAVADPEKFGRDKKRKNEKKREKRKEKSLGFRDQRRGW